MKAIEIIAIYGHLFKNIYKYNTIKNTWLYCPDGCMWDDFSNIKLSIEQMQLYQPDTRKRTFELIICSRSQEDI